MKHEGVSVYQSLLTACAGLALSALFLFPAAASALEVKSTTAQLLPLGGNTCAPIAVSDFTPYVYNGELNSFEFTVTDPSYVLVAASVKDTSVPLNFVTRLPDSSGSVRVHVDLYSTSLAGSAPVTLTLLSAQTGKPVCASVVSVDLGTGTPAPVTYVPHPTPVQPSAPQPAPAAATSAQATTAAPAVVNLAQSPAKGLCISDASAYRLWLVLLVIYALVVGGLLWLEFPMSWPWARTPERVATIILALLIVLLGFWYLSASCRAALWMPLLAFLIAILGLLAAFWNHPKVTRLLLLEQRTTIITPPPAKK